VEARSQPTFKVILELCVAVFERFALVLIA
jgi:hypothetical protein